MKRAILVFVLCSLLLCLAACGNTGAPGVENDPRFNTNEEMLQFMEGLWVAEENTTEKTYYVFHDNQICVVTDALYSAAVKKLLDSALQNGGLDVLTKQDFETVSKRMYLSDISYVPDPILLYPKSGEIKLSEKETIAIINNTAYLKTTTTETGVALNKLADTAEFSAKPFQTLFDQVKDAYEVPASYLFMPTEEYGEQVRAALSITNTWPLTVDEDNLKIYTPMTGLSPLEGSSLVISKESLGLTYQLSSSTGFIGSKYEQSLVINYRPEDGAFRITDENTSMNQDLLISYGLCTVLDFPGAYTDPAALYRDMTIYGQKETSGFTEKTSMTSNGITYKLSTTQADLPMGSFTVENGYTMKEFSIEIKDKIPLTTILKATTENTPTQNEESNTPAPDNTEPATTPVQSGTLEQLLDGSKSWVGEWELEGWIYNVFFVFNEDGTCYFALGDMELFGAGKGTYTVKDNKTISLDLKMNGEKSPATYTFDPDTFSLTVVSVKGFKAKKGDVFYLQENTNQDVEIIKSWADSFADGMPESSTWE